MKSGSLPRTLLGAILSIGLLTLGCSSNNNGPASKADAGKKDTGASGGSGGSSARGGSSGSGGSSASGGASGSGGGSGGSSASGGSGGAGGTSASGGSGGSSNAGGSAAGGSGGTGGSAGSAGSVGGSGAGGTGGARASDAGAVQVDGGGSSDVESSDAQDAPIVGDDGAASEVGSSNDGGASILLDTGAQDSESPDIGAIDTTVALLDAGVDVSGVDAAPDVAPDTADAGTCLQQIIGNGYAFLPASPCGQCQDTTQPSHPDLHTQCQAMIDCLEAAFCQSSSNNCWLACRNTVSGNQIATETCVAALVTAACH